MRIGEIERVGEREIPMPALTPPAPQVPAPERPAPSREREPDRVPGGRLEAGSRCDQGA
jgi:hypothetical protein